MSDARLTTLQAVRLKGRTTPDAVAAATGEDEGSAERTLGSLLADGFVQEAKGRYRLTPEGKETLAGWLAEEREGVDQASLEPHYEAFAALNGDFKQAVTAWQQKGGEPNDHSDADYDAGVLAQIDDIDAQLQPILGDLVAIAPRLGHYPARFRNALEQMKAGDHQYFLHPLKDSYHQVWFELHEDLIGLAGHSRLDEAAAGRAD